MSCCSREISDWVAIPPTEPSVDRRGASCVLIEPERSSRIIAQSSSVWIVDCSIIGPSASTKRMNRVANRVTPIDARNASDSDEERYDHQARIARKQSTLRITQDGVGWTKLSSALGEPNPTEPLFVLRPKSLLSRSFMLRLPLWMSIQQLRQ